MLWTSEEPSKAVVLASGGMDSTCLLSYLQSLGWSIQPITFNYGSKHNDVEFSALMEVCKNLMLSLPVRFDLRGIFKYFQSDLLQSGGEIPEGHYAHESMSRTVVPGRNSIMLTIAAGYAESIGFDTIAIANHAGDHFIYPDCRPQFMGALSDAIDYSSDNKVHLFAPFTHKDKVEICKIGHELGAPLHLTWSCYKGQPSKHCGLCGTCQERHYAFRKAGIVDPTEYENDPTTHFTSVERKETGVE